MWAVDIILFNVECCTWSYCEMQPSDQAALRALTARSNVEETPDDTPEENRNAKTMKDALGSALTVSVSGETSQVIFVLVCVAIYHVCHEFKHQLSGRLCLS